ncbi:MAG: HAMP domain-containing histidine kinase [Elusimicrobia bacterium]|nr:HAMP domain-containing histidine kinase [Elusimicrobiota bacterium]
MIRFKLKTQLLLVVAFVELFAIGMGLSYLLQSQAQERLERSFREDLVVLTKLPQLRDSLRSLDDATDRYLVSGDRKSLERRQSALADLRSTTHDIDSVLKTRSDERPLFDLERRIARYVAQQEQWIAQKQSGRLSPADAARLASLSTPFEEIAGGVTDLKQVSVEHLDRRRDVVRRAARAGLIVILLTGLVSSILLGVFISRHMIEPILGLESKAKAWQLGDPWEFNSQEAGPEVASLVRCMRELTERLNQQYKREKELGEIKTQLVSTISHEFNNAMTIIVGVTALLEDSDGESPERRKRYYGMIKDNVKALTMACSNLINMGRLESGRFALSLRRVELQTLLQDAALRLEVLSLRKKLDVSVELPQAPLPVRADPESLTLVVTNLLSNAIKYTPEGGKIALGLRSAGNGVEVFCRDTGIGIAPEDRERILGGYYRTETGRKTAKGFGVGLALANSLVQAHGSRLDIDSEPQKGSTFRFTLPSWTE